MPIASITPFVLRRPAACLLAMLAAAGIACGAAPTGTRPVVVVTVPPQAWFVERIAGDRVEIAVLVPPGANPTTHAPDLQALAAMSRAALWVAVGHPAFAFERAWLAPLRADRAELVVLEGAAGLETRADDPHYWLSPSHARAFAAALGQALIELLPADRAELEISRDALLQEIDRVDIELARRFEPRRGGTFLVMHPAWGYLAAAYGLRQLAVETHGKQPDPRALAEQIALARELGVRVVFVQTQFDASAAEVVASEIGGRVEPLDPLAYDWAGNLRDVAQRLSKGLVP